MAQSHEQREPECQASLNDQARPAGVVALSMLSRCAGRERFSTSSTEESASTPSAAASGLVACSRRASCPSRRDPVDCPRPEGARGVVTLFSRGAESRGHLADAPGPSRRRERSRRGSGRRAAPRARRLAHIGDREVLRRFAWTGSSVRTALLPRGRRRGRRMGRSSQTQCLGPGEMSMGHRSTLVAPGHGSARAESGDALRRIARHDDPRSRSR